MSRQEHHVDLPVVAWAGWPPDAAEPAQGGTLSPAPALPASLRRRVGAVGRRALQAAWLVLAGRTDTAPRIVLSSRHGEYDRTITLLDALARGEAPSPADFSLAVHHGLAGLLSIATGNHAGHTAIAAGADTLGTALIEAAACLADGDTRVLVMHFDQDLPPPYGSIVDGDETRGAFALLLGTTEPALRLRLRWRPAADGNPVATQSDLLALLQGTADSFGFAGERQSWTLCRQMPAKDACRQMPAENACRHSPAGDGVP